MSLYTTTDMMTTVIGFVDVARKALRSECDISIAEYRLLASLTDHGEPVRPASVTKALGVSPAMTTLTANSLVNKGLVERNGAKGATRLTATRQGAALCKDADNVLAGVHHALLSPLDDVQRDTIVVGTQMTVAATTGSNRVKDDSFFAEYETLCAFLVIERVMTESAQSSGLPMNGFRILFRLDETGGHATPGELSETLALSPPVVTHALKALERDGMVTRSAEKLDKRSIRVRMTEQGARILEKAIQHMEPQLISGIRTSTASERRLIQEACEIMALAVRKHAQTRGDYR